MTCNVLQNGMNVHLKNNTVLRECFDLGPVCEETKKKMAKQERVSFIVLLSIHKSWPSNLIKQSILFYELKRRNTIFKIFFRYKQKLWYDENSMHQQSQSTLINKQPAVFIQTNLQ